MKATEAKLLEFLRKSPQFVIPIYQRTYSWTEGECRQFWNDIIRCGKDDRIAVHFIGSIVYIESGLSQVSHQAPLLVIDNSGSGVYMWRHRCIFSATPLSSNQAVCVLNLVILKSI